MAHEIELRVDGTGAAVYAREAAWHGLGNVYTDREGLTLTEVLNDVHELGTDVDLVPMEAVTADGTRLPTDAWATVRRPFYLSPAGAQLPELSPAKVLGTGLSDQYRVLQNREAMQILQDIVEESGAIYEAAGSLKDGAQAWVLARLPETVKVGGEDSEEHVPFLLATNSFDGSLAVGFHATHVRVVCKNTVNLALGSTKASFRIRHDETMEGRIAEARKALGIVFEHGKVWQEEMERLLTVEIGPSAIDLFLEKLITVRQDATEITKSNAVNKRSVIRDIYLHAPDLDKVRGSAYGLIQAVADFADHRTPVGQERRFRAAMLGDDSLTVAAHKLLTVSA